MNSSERLSAGLKALPDKISSFASTQAAWRFYRNESVSLSVLQEPLTAAAHEGIAKHCSQYALCVHDWSHLSYKHINKTDTYAITHATDIGYDLQTSLIVSDQNGQPLAPVAQRLASADGSYATYGDSTPALPIKDHLDEVSDCIQYLDGQGFAKPLVHLIDREGDSVGHMRCWETKRRVAAGWCGSKIIPKWTTKTSPWPVNPWRKNWRSSRPDKSVITARLIGSGWRKRT